MPDADSELEEAAPEAALAARRGARGAADP